jgi:predicted TIM-barrel fold metal-dependent hydrolase
MVIDGHCHVWPDKVASRALGSAPGERFGDGTRGSLIDVMAASGVDRAVSLGVAATPENVESANRFAGSLDPQHFIGFGSVHAGLSAEENVASLRRHGLRGAKVHPYFQRFALDDPRLWETFDAMRGEFCVIAHVGAAGDHDGSLCTPEMVRKIVKQFPDLDFIACHFGGYQQLDEAEPLIGVPVYFDTAWPPSLDTIPRARLRSLIERHGPERIIFASDWPMADPLHEREVIEDLGLDDDAVAAILGGNLARLLRL